MKRPWTKTIQQHWRVEVEGGRYFPKGEKDYYIELARDLNELLREHNCFKNYSAYATYDEIDICTFCHEKYEEDYNEDTKEYFCANCGKGAKEMMLEQLKH